jgi:hypothetical protein
LFTAIGSDAHPTDFYNTPFLARWQFSTELPRLRREEKDSSERAYSLAAFAKSGDSRRETTVKWAFFHWHRHCLEKWPMSAKLWRWVAAQKAMPQRQKLGGQLTGWKQSEDVDPAELPSR